MMAIAWGQRCVESIKKEKAEAEKRYGIKISQTEIYCAWCEKPAGFFHTCPSIDPERKEGIKRIKYEYERPWVPWKTDWQGLSGIQFGMSREEAFEKFREWQGSKKTCDRCQENEYKYEQYCPVRLICKEAQNGSSDNKSVDLRKKPGPGDRDFSVNSLRVTPKRLSVDKSWR